MVKSAGRQALPIASATVGAVFDLFPVLGPLFSPVHRAAAPQADFLGEEGFVAGEWFFHLCTKLAGSSARLCNPERAWRRLCFNE